MRHRSFLPSPENPQSRMKTEQNQKKKKAGRQRINTCATKRCQKARQTYSEAVVVAETVGRGIVQTQMGCGQGRRRREVGRLAQIRKKRELLRGRAQTEWNSVWHSAGHLQTWRQRVGKNYSLCYVLRVPEGVRVIQFTSY